MSIESMNVEHDDDMDDEADGIVVANHLLDIRSAIHSSWEKPAIEGDLLLLIDSDTFYD